MKSFVVSILLLVVFGCVLSVAQVNVTTAHNDIGRTGQNMSETHLTTGNVVKTQFGLICKISLSAIGPTAFSYQVYAQPLVVANSDGSINIYAVTQGDYLYAITVPAGFSGNCSSLTYAYKNLILQGDVPAFPVDCCFIGGLQCQTIAPTVGVLGTPVIDTSTNTLYVVSEYQVGPNGNYSPGNCLNSSQPSNWIHRLHAIDLSSSNFLAEKYNGPATIQGTLSTGKIFASKMQIQRPGLLWLSASQAGASNNVVYAGFSMMDATPAPFPPGWAFSYNAQNLTDSNYPKFFATTPTVGQSIDGGGIWGGGGGLAAGVDSSSGNTFLYFGTGDGTFDADQSGSDYGESFVKLNTSLAFSNYFADWNAPSDGCACVDKDFGSGGVTLIPDGYLNSSGNGYLAIVAGKEKNIYAIDRHAPGNFHGSCNTRTCPGFNMNGGCNGAPPSCTGTNSIQGEILGASTHIFHNNPAFWSGNGYLYYAGVYDVLKAYPVSNTCASGTPPVCNAVAATNNGTGFGVSPSLSSNGSSTSSAIVWSILSDGSVWAAMDGGAPAVLYAFQASPNGSTLTELYDSNQCFQNHVQVDQPGPATKFSVPTVANGYVIIGTQTDVDIYGSVAQRTCNTN